MKNFTGIGIGIILLGLIRFGIKTYSNYQYEQISNSPSMIQMRDSFARRMGLIVDSTAQPEEEPQERIVYFCQGRKAKTYHTDECCDSLNLCLSTCHAEIIAALEHEAQEQGLRPCSKCTKPSNSITNQP